jgi:nucleoside-diphosphate-sugar epimerase
MSNKSIFITGGAGYVGSKLVPFLLNNNYNVTVLDLMIYGENILNEHKNLKIIKGDIRNENLLRSCIPGHDAVIHLACISNDPSFELNPLLGKSINLDPFEPLVKISKQHGVKKFIYASSSSVYGIKEEKDVHEEMSLEPLTDYSKFKAECEKILNDYMSPDFITCTIRPATVCGYAPRQRLDVVVNILTNFAYHKNKIQVFGGNQLRPNIHIDDMVQSYVSVLEANPNLINGQIFNVGYENQTVNDIAGSVRDVIGNHVIIENVKTDDNRSYHVSSKKIFKVLNFKANKNIADAALDLKHAFDNKLLSNTFDNEMYFNIKRMQSINLK